MTTRSILAITGADRVAFLQSLVSNDVERASPDAPIYAALLTPQGKYLADFFVLPMGDAHLIDVAESHAASLAQRLSMYRLRRDVDIAPSALNVAHDDAGLPDPRHPALPRRLYGTRAHTPDPVALRVTHLIPETGIELTPDTYILEAGFERLNGVDFRKGCYVGQEITARMKHKATLRKGLVRLRIDGAAEPGTEILTNGRQAGVLFSQAEGHALAHMRHDRISNDMTAGEAKLSPAS